jgi:hypothetical protein
MTPTKPTTVAAVRGLLYALLTAAIGVLVAATPVELAALGPWAPLLVLLARVGEAALLDRRQPPQAGPLGGQDLSMGTGYWSQSACRGDTWWWGVVGSGTWYWTARFGTQWVGGTVYQLYAWQGYECGALGPPINPYGYIPDFGGGEGMWFENGCIIFRYTTARWTTYYGQYGQLANRLAGGLDDDPRFEEHPADLPDPRKDRGATGLTKKPKEPKPPKAPAPKL